MTSRKLSDRSGSKSSGFIRPRNLGAILSVVVGLLYIFLLLYSSQPSVHSSRWVVAVNIFLTVTSLQYVLGQIVRWTVRMESKKPN